MSTKDKVIEATVELVNEKGYKGATTKEIAKRAGVNEVTIFRHFGNKKGIVEAAVEKYTFAGPLFDYFYDRVVWDIEQDLTMLARQYRTLLHENQFVILLSMREANQFPELNQLISRAPQKYKHILENYLTEMMEKKKIKQGDIPTIVDNFIFLNFGYFMMKNRIDSNQEMAIDTFIEHHIHVFIQSIR